VSLLLLLLTYATHCSLVGDEIQTLLFAIVTPN